MTLGGGLQRATVVDGQAVPGDITTQTGTLTSGPQSSALQVPDTGAGYDPNALPGAGTPSDSGASLLDQTSKSLTGGDGSSSWFGKNGVLAQNQPLVTLGGDAVKGLASGLLTQNQNTQLAKAYTANADNQRAFVQGNYALPTGRSAIPATTGLLNAGAAAAPMTPAAVAPATGGQYVYNAASGQIVYQPNTGAVA